MGNNSEQQKQSILEKLRELFTPKKEKEYKARIKTLEANIKTLEDTVKMKEGVAKFAEKEMFKEYLKNEKLKEKNFILSRKNAELDNQKKKLESIFQILEKDIKIKIKDIEYGYSEQMESNDFECDSDILLEQMAASEENKEIIFVEDGYLEQIDYEDILGQMAMLERTGEMVFEDVDTEMETGFFDINFKEVTELLNIENNSKEYENLKGKIDYLKQKNKNLTFEMLRSEESKSLLFAYLKETLSNFSEDITKQFTKALEDVNKTPEKTPEKAIEQSIEIDFKM